MFAELLRVLYLGKCKPKFTDITHIFGRSDHYYLLKNNEMWTILKNAIFQNVTPCGSFHFRGT
jgi:hypothetical protein